MAEIRWKKKGTSPTYKRRNKNNNFPTRLNVSNISTRPPTPQKNGLFHKNNRTDLSEFVPPRKHEINLDNYRYDLRIQEYTP